jgi:hypothetical protein
MGKRIVICGGGAVGAAIAYFTSVAGLAGRLVPMSGIIHR